MFKCTRNLFRYVSANTFWGGYFAMSY